MRFLYFTEFCIYSEKENIWTFDSKGELLLTIMSSLAQEESRSISENVTWGQRKRMADGKVSFAYSRFLGLDKDKETGKIVVVPEQAETVRLIFKLFLEGMTPHSIAAELTKRGIKTPSGKDVWNQQTVRRMLSNEKYKSTRSLIFFKNLGAFFVDLYKKVILCGIICFLFMLFKKSQKHIDKTLSIVYNDI